MIEALAARGMKCVRARRTISRLTWSALACALSQPAAGLAQAPTATGATVTGAAGTTQLIGSIGTARYVSEERLSSGTLFNREEGDLLRWELDLRHTVENWTWRLSAEQSSGTIDYRGRNQLGLPLRTLTDLKRDEFALGLEYRWGWETFGATLGAGMDMLRTRRHIRPAAISGALTETLRSDQLFLRAGAFVETAFAERPLRLAGSLQLNQPFSQTLSVDTHGVADAFVLRPESRSGGRLRFDAAWSIGGNFDITCHFGQETYRPGPSAPATAFRNGVAVGGASYPGSVQKLRFGGVGGVWQFR